MSSQANLNTTGKPPVMASNGSTTSSSAKSQVVARLTSLSIHTTIAPSTAARDQVIETPELLENILRFTGNKTLLTSVLRVNKYFNTLLTGSPNLQRAMFESFPLEGPLPLDKSTKFLTNSALPSRISVLRGTKILSIEATQTRRVQVNPGRNLWGEDNKGPQRLKIICEQSPAKKSPAKKSPAKSVGTPRPHPVPAPNWHKLRVVLPLDNAATFHAQIVLRDWCFDTYRAKQELAADITLGELCEWVEAQLYEPPGMNLGCL